MAIADFPVVLQPAIQQRFLQRMFWMGLTSTLGYRAAAVKIPFPNNIGETYTSSRASRLVPSLTALDPASNTGLDNGLTPVQWAVEQFTMTLNLWAQTMDLDIFSQHVGIAERFLLNAKNLGLLAQQILDRLAQKELFDAYMSGNTIVTATLGSNGPTIAVDDIRGFRTVLVNGVPTAVSSTNPLPVTVNGVASNIISFTVDGTNVSSAAIVGGISGTLTAAANILVANGTANNVVLANDAPTIVRVNDRARTGTLVQADYLTMIAIIDAVSVLRSNAIPAIGGYYNLYLNEKQINGLFRDSDFREWHRGLAGTSTDFSQGVINDLLGVRIIRTTEGKVQTSTVVTKGIQRAILCGEGALYEGDYAGTQNYVAQMGDLGRSDEIEVIDNVVFATRPPLDRLQNKVSQSFFVAVGWTCPTDALSTPSIIPTANNARYKRAVIIESA